MREIVIVSFLLSVGRGLSTEEDNSDHIEFYLL